MKLRRLLEIDARWSLRLHMAERPGALRALASFLAHSGDSWFWFIGLAILYWRGHACWKTWSLHVIVMIAILATIVLSIKLLVRRSRPEGEWGALYRTTDPHSFPSGHAARSALLALLAVAWGPPWLAWILIPWAPMVSLARVSLGVHYLSDVIGGSLLGLLFGLIGLLVYPLSVPVHQCLVP
ncbi:MAG: phosphatase PAP2 family protein [Anaerolineales bacterium]